MNGVDGDTKNLQQKFLHDAVELTLSSCPLLKDLKDKFSGNRVNGSVDVDFSVLKPDWDELVDFIELIQKIDEGDLIQFCLNYKLEDLKKKGIE